MSKEKSVSNNSLSPRMFDILRKPIVSEKAVKASEAGKVVFKVDISATKQEIAKAVKAIYNVEPKKVNIVVLKGKTKRFRNKNTGTQADVKKAYVSLPEGAKIDFTVKA